MIPDACLVKRGSEETHQLPANSWLCQGRSSTRFVGLEAEPMPARLHGGGLDMGADSIE